MTELTAESLQKRFGPVAAVSDVSLRVSPSEVVGLLGPNGAGKTTTLRMLAGILPPTAGRVRVGGLDVREHRSRPSGASASSRATRSSTSG